MKRIFISAIGTDCGKTVASAMVCEAMEADYWKPIQSGLSRDTDRVQTLISNPKTVFHKEAYLLKTPESPHAAAIKDKIEINLSEIKLPKTSNHLVIEGAGGLLVPLNDNDFVIDLIQHLDAELILVINFYLGSINHTLLSLQEIKRRGIPLKGIILNGHINTDSKDIIMKNCSAPILAEIAQEKELNKAVVMKYAGELRAKLEYA